jgi:hypothetical protein
MEPIVSSFSETRVLGSLGLANAKRLIAPKEMTMTILVIL